MSKKVVKPCPEPMETYTHEEYIAALQMSGKEPVVTAATVRAQANKAQRSLPTNKKIEGSVGHQWEKERAKEMEESEQERMQRISQKEAAMKKIQTSEWGEKDSPPRRGSSNSLNKVNLPPLNAPNKISSIPSSNTPQISATNYIVLCAKESNSIDILPELKKNNAELVNLSNISETCEWISKEGSTLSTVNARIVVIMSGNEDPSQVQKLIEITSEMTRPPPILFLVKPEQNRTFLSLHQPPYVVVTSKEDGLWRFIRGTQCDLNPEEEMAVKSKLVRCEENEEREGRVIIPNMEKDIRLTGRREPVQEMTMALYWIGKDLDLSCILLSNEGAHIATCSFLETSYGEGSISHSGDMLDAPNGAKEAISINMSKLPSEVVVIYFVVNSYSGESFSQVKTVDASLSVKGHDGYSEGFAQFPLGGSGSHKAMVICRLLRTDAQAWCIQNINLQHPSACTARLLVKPVQQHYISNPCPKW